MQFTTIFAIAAAALVGTVAAQDCTGSQQTTAFVALSTLLTGTDLDQCATASGYNMLMATGLPTDAQTTKMCGIPACQSLIKSVISKNPPNCVLTIPTSGAKMNVYNLANNFAGDCTRLVVTAPAPAAATPAPATKAPSAPATGSTPAAATPTATATPSATATPTSTKTAC